MKLTHRRLLRESVPIAGLLFVWYALGALVAALAGWATADALSLGFRTVGIATAAVFIVVRGVAIARRTDSVHLSGDLRELLHESTVVAGPVLAWVGLAFLIALPFSLFGWFRDPGMLVAIAVQTAISTAGLYIVVRVVPVLRSGFGLDGTTASGDD